MTKSHTWTERMVFFPCDRIRLAGVLTVPAIPNGFTVLIPWGSGTFPSSGRARIRTRLARELADEGFHAFRFDYRGVGESEGEYRLPDMAKPNKEEIEAACAWLDSEGLHHVVIAAYCFGAWSALMAAPAIAGLAGVAIVNTPVWRDHSLVTPVNGAPGWWIKKLKRLNMHALRSPEMRSRIRRLFAFKVASLVGVTKRDDRFSTAVTYLLEQEIPLLVIYGDDDFRVDFQSELEHGLGAAIEQAGARARRDRH